MKKKSLVLALGLIGLCQVQFLRAPEGFSFGGARSVEPAPREGGRNDENDPFKRDRGNELRDILTNQGGKSGQGTTGMGSGKPNPVGGKGGTSSDVPVDIILVEGRTGLGKLDKAEKAAIRKIDKERPSFAEDEDKNNADDVSRASSRLADLKDGKIKVIEDFRSELDSLGLNSGVLRHCEGLKNYKVIEKEIQNFYKKVIAKGDFDPQEMKVEMARVLEVINGLRFKLASQLYTREANKLSAKYPKEEDSIMLAAKRAWRGDFEDASGRDMDPFEWVFKKINSIRKSGTDAKIAEKTAQAEKKAVKAKAAGAAN